MVRRPPHDQRQGNLRIPGEAPQTGEEMNALSKTTVGRTFWSALILSLVFLTTLTRADEKPTDVKLEPIFNGNDLTGWTLEKAGAKPPDPATKDYWKAVDGVLIGESDDAKKGSMLYTQK